MEKEKCIKTRKPCSFILFCREYRLRTLNVFLPAEICITLLARDDLPVHRAGYQVWNQICKQHVAFDRSIFTTYFWLCNLVNCLITLHISVWLYHCQAYMMNLLTPLLLHTDVKLTAYTIHSQSGIGIHPTSCFNTAPEKLLICISMEELTVQNTPVNLRLLQKQQVWSQDQKHRLQRYIVSDTDATRITVKTLPAP
jgi:hypothetical protein